MADLSWGVDRSWRAALRALGLKSRNSVPIGGRAILTAQVDDFTNMRRPLEQLRGIFFGNGTGAANGGFVIQAGGNGIAIDQLLFDDATFPTATIEIQDDLADLTTVIGVDAPLLKHPARLIGDANYDGGARTNFCAGVPSGAQSGGIMQSAGLAALNPQPKPFILQPGQVMAIVPLAVLWAGRMSISFVEFPTN